MNANKRRYSFLMVAAVAVVFLSITAENAKAGDPVPGVDVSLEQIPGGIVGKSTTDKDGKFSFDKLRQGDYVLRISPPSTKVENHNSSRSHKTYRVLPNGVEEHSVSIELRIEARPGRAKYEDIKIVVTAKQGGRIVGRVTFEDVGIKEEGVE